MGLIKPAGLTAALSAGVVVAAFGLSGGATQPASLHAATTPLANGATWVLAINGGGNAATNYQSHLLHLRDLLSVLTARGVPADHMTVLASDGADPTADLAVREGQTDKDFWLLEGTRLEQRCKPPITQANSQIPAVQIQPATRASLARWFGRAQAGLRAGDTLLLYVTDHGTRNQADPKNNRITLWGEGQNIDVDELQLLLQTLDPGVRVVSLMSQCYSGGFERLQLARGKDNLPDGSVCGYFSSTADRPAYGCFPESRSRANVGHSFHFIDSLAAQGQFSGAHGEVLASDQTPDVPLRTSDAFLANLVTRAAAHENTDETKFADTLLRQAWREPAHWESELRQLDRISERFGITSARTLEELGDRTKKLGDLMTRLETQSKQWASAMGDMTQANLNVFTRAHADWQKRLEDSSLDQLQQPQLRALTTELLGVMRSGLSKADRTRLEKLEERKTSSAGLRYRMEVRMAVLLRMKTLLTDVAGHVYLNNKGSADERAALASLERCEDFRLGPARGAPIARVAPPPAFPKMDEDMAKARAILPAYLGINFGDVPDVQRSKLGLDEGASRITQVFPDSPAQAAGLQVADIAIGPPGHPFTRSKEIRTWTAFLELGKKHPLEVLRDGKRIVVDIVPRELPAQWPAPPGPPKLSTPAPALSSAATYRGQLPPNLRDGKSRILLFWATWCGPCKASLPELTAFSNERKVPVIAITDEPPEVLDGFFKKYAGPFPSIVASDEQRKSFQDYGVSGLPTIVFIDESGKIKTQRTGYLPGLGIEGWSWKQAPASAPH